MCVCLQASDASSRCNGQGGEREREKDKTDVGGPTGVQIWGLGKPDIDGAGGAPGKMLGSWPSVRVI